MDIKTLVMKGQYVGNRGRQYLIGTEDSFSFTKRKIRHNKFSWAGDLALKMKFRLDQNKVYFVQGVTMVGPDTQIYGVGIGRPVEKEKQVFLYEKEKNKQLFLSRGDKRFTKNKSTWDEVLQAINTSKAGRWYYGGIAYPICLYNEIKKGDYLGALEHSPVVLGPFDTIHKFRQNKKEYIINDRFEFLE